MEAQGRDDPLTLISISVLAWILQNVLHEGVGHGLTAWLSGAKSITLSTVAMQSDNSSRWISANGTLVNLAAAVVFWGLLSMRRRYTPQTRYFLVLSMAGSLFTGTGYFLFSGALNFGDWADVIQGLEPHWLWRIGLFLLGVVSYYLAMLLVAAHLRPFGGHDDRGRRFRWLCWTPYATDPLLGVVAGLRNPGGPFLILVSALPATLGANSGLISLPFMLRARNMPEEKVGLITRRPAWIVAAAVVTLVFVIVLGRGLTWTR